MVSRAIILAAGKGTRLAPLTDYLPKELIEVNGKAIIELLVEAIVDAGISSIQIVISPSKYAIKRYLGSGSKYGAEITYRIQQEPLGTADAVAKCHEFVKDDPFLVAYGDTYLTDFKALRHLINIFDGNNMDFALLVQKVSDPERFGIVKLDDEMNVVGLVEKPDPEVAIRYATGNSYLAIRGFLVLKSKMMPLIKDTKTGMKGEKWLTDSLKNALEKGFKGTVHVSNSDIFDIGTKEVMKKISQSYMNGR